MNASELGWTSNESPRQSPATRFFSAVDRQFDMDADAITTPGYLALRQLTEVQIDTVMRKVAKSGATSYLPCTVNLNEEEIETEGQIVVCRVAISGNARSTRYAA